MPRPAITRLAGNFEGLSRRRSPGMRGCSCCSPMNPISRRRFALGLGARHPGGAAAGGLLRGTSRADTGKTASRLVVFFSPNGNNPTSTGRPTGTEIELLVPGRLHPGAAREKHKRRTYRLWTASTSHGVDNHEAGMAAMLTGGGDATTASAAGCRSINSWPRRLVTATSSVRWRSACRPAPGAATSRRGCRTPARAIRASGRRSQERLLAHVRRQPR